MMSENADFAWLVTTGAISRQAREWAAGKPMALWDGRELVEMARRYH
jgi:restriction endonuclease Mrr